ncbi:hypothetical protein ACQ4PT_066807 [Festuca glaucescens]
MDGRRWSDLPADVLREISSHVCAAVDFVYFHAVCKPWRSSRDPLSKRTITTQFLPWLLAAADKESTNLRFRCIFSESSYHGKPPMPLAAAARNWVSNADGTEVRYLTVEDLCPTLHDPFTGEFSRLPDFPEDVRGWEEENPRGVIYSDRTIFLYSIRYHNDDDHRARFRAALLRPGSDKWTVIERTLQAPSGTKNFIPRYGEFCTAYHSGKIMLTVKATLWHMIRSEGGHEAGGDLLVKMPPLPRWTSEYYSRKYSYVLESRGELLWASVKIDICSDWHGVVTHELSMTVYVLQVEASAQEMKTRWVEKDVRSVADRLLFLGTPCSFAVDASRLGRHGGCAYFVYCRKPCDKVGVFSYNLLSDKATFFERLPQGWNDERCTWHVLQPTVSPIQLLEQDINFTIGST